MTITINKICPLTMKKCMGRKCVACVVYQSYRISGRTCYSTGDLYLRCSYLKRTLKVLKESEHHNC